MVRGRRELFKQRNYAPIQQEQHTNFDGQLGDVHEGFSQLFPVDVRGYAANTRPNARRHGRQFQEIWGNSVLRGYFATRAF